MARKRIRRRTKPVEDYDEVEDLEAEEAEEEAPAPKRSRRQRKPRVVDDVEEHEPEEQFEGDDEGDGEFEDDDYDDEPDPKTTTKKSAKKPAKKAAKKPAKKTVTEPEVIEVKKVDDQVAEGVFSELLEAMDEGQAVIAVRLPGNKWQFMTGDVQTTSTGGVKLKGKEFDGEVQTIEYQEFIVEWSDLTYQEKVKKAKKLKVAWETHDDNRVDNIRLMLAVRDKLGIEKYKPDYINKSARDRLKGK